MTSQVFATANRALKIAIIDSGRTQRAIARSARIDETRFSRIVSGQVQTVAKERRRIARVLRKPEAELFPDVEALAS